MYQVSDYLPRQVNSGPLLTAYTLDELLRHAGQAPLVLPICSLGTSVEQLFELGSFVLPPLYHEALDDTLKPQILERIHQCFPFLEGTNARAESAWPLRVVELPRQNHPPLGRARVLAFSVDTAVEEHGPHLPLMTDTLQSYSVLQKVAAEFDGVIVGPPVEYGHLTWGLPFGLSIDLTPPLLTQYVRRFVDAVQHWMRPDALYVVDVHGSIVHRNAIQEGLRASSCSRWAFRWLHESLVEFAGERGDQHAGGVETSLIHHITPTLVDLDWWPARLEDLVAGQMSLDEAIRLSENLDQFIQHVQSTSANGIVGNVRNFFDVDAAEMADCMLVDARQDLVGLTAPQP